jgi:hypothetical protein
MSTAPLRQEFEDLIRRNLIRSRWRANRRPSGGPPLSVLSQALSRYWVPGGEAPCIRPETSI